MPPKAKKNEPSKKTDQKKKEKVIEDKTFGLKNKKGAKQQKFIKTVTHQVKFAGTKTKLEELNKPGDKPKKKEAEELNAFFKPVQTVGKGADPKSVLCAFFKQGQCGKGSKCKFSHDLNIVRKGEKKNVYEDVRDEDNMEDWDETKLEEVVNKKHGESDKAKPKTSIICKFFLEAVETSKYGWFWECPNGGQKCMYRHALPPGFVLKKDQKKEDKVEQISIEDLVEKERAALGHNTTKVTLETFLKWKERKKREKIENKKASMDKKKADYKMGKALGISGRELFEFNPDLVAGDDAEADEGTFEREPDEEDDGMEVREINLDYMSSVATEVDGTGTIATERSRVGEPSSAEIDQSDDSKLGEAAALPPAAGSGDTETDKAIAMAMAATTNGDGVSEMAIDEGLFDGEDLDLVEEDLETLELDND